MQRPDIPISEKIINRLQEPQHVLGWQGVSGGWDGAGMKPAESRLKLDDIKTFLVGYPHQ